jgi:hypothetical protein
VVRGGDAGVRCIYIITSQPVHQLSVAVMFLMLGGYLSAAKWIYVGRLLRITKRAGRLPATMSVEIAANGPLKVSADGDRTELDPKRVFGFKVADFGVLIYLQRNMFFLLKRDAAEQAGGVDMLLEILKGRGIKQMR